MNSQARRENILILSCGFFALAFTHLFSLSQVAGWHLDEAWAGNFAHRIAFEKSFWPLQAMTPYTTAWSHYLAAIAFRLFGTSVFIYRATGILEVLLGIALISAALIKRGELRAAALLPGIIAFFPALVMNHRWVIEMNTFFVFCAGLIAYGLATKKNSLLYAGSFLGITSHVLFLAPCLALFYWCWAKGGIDRAQRFRISIFSLIMTAFFAHLYGSTLSDDHLKALALLVFSIVTIFTAWIPSPPEKLRKLFIFVPAGLGLPLLFPFFLFTEGSWLALFSNGQLQTPLLIGTFFIPVVLLLFYAKPKITIELAWLPLCLLLTLIMVVKPGPRYYEVPFLFCAVLTSITLARTTPAQASRVLGLWFIFGSLQLGMNYFQPGRAEIQVDRTFHFWRFHDSSADMLPIQRVARRLSQEGCDYSDLKLTDDRMKQCLEFLSYGDWPAPHPHLCALGSELDILRSSGNEGQFAIVSAVTPPSGRE